MIKQKWVGTVAVLLMVAAVFVIGFFYLYPAALPSVTKTVAPKYASAMDKTKVLDIQIVADEAQWANMLANATDEEYIPATVIIDGKKIENVGIRPKGNSSLSSVARDDTTDRYSFKIEFDHYITGQTWLGLDKIVVNNMQGDASYLKEYLSYDIMAYAGVQAPLYTFADITVNGEAWGFYLAVETLEDSYAQRVFGTDHGMLYKPDSMGVRGEGRMDEFIQELGDGAEGQLQSNRQSPPQGNWQQPAEGGEAVPQGVTGGETNEAPPGTAPEGITGGQPPQGVPGEQLLEGMPNEEPQVAESQEQPAAGGWNVPQGGGMRNNFGGGMTSGGVSLQYTDDEPSSYPAIFENAAFDSTEKDYARVIAALKKLANGEDLENTVDVEAVLKYFAAHTVVVSLDSYVSGMGHNYYLYEEDGQLTILPWDYNLSFGGFQSGNASSVVNFPIDTPVSGVSLADRPLLGKLLEVPAYLELYHSYLQEIVEGYFNSGLFEETVDSLNALIAPHVEKDPSAFYDYAAYTVAVAELKELGLLRAESVKGQLAGTVPSTTEGQSANPDALIDASSIDLSVLGNQGGGITIRIGGGGDREGGFIEMQNIDPEVMQKAMTVIQGAGEKELTEDQLAELVQLGLTEEQIALIKGMASRGTGGQGGRGLNINTGTGGATWMGEAGDSPGGQGAATTAGYDTGTWIMLGGSVALLLGGILFVLSYKRRRR